MTSPTNSTSSPPCWRPTRAQLQQSKLAIRDDLILLDLVALDLDPAQLPQRSATPAIDAATHIACAATLLRIVLQQLKEAIPSEETN
jgi:hypothetical protein